MRLSGALAERSKAKATPGVLLPAVKEHMLKVYTGGNDRAWDIIHPSELAHQKTFCPRAVYLRITEGKLAIKGESFDFVRDNIFDEGHAIHAKWQERLRQATPLFGNWCCAICGAWAPQSLEPGPEYIGHCAYVNVEHIWEYQEITLDARDEWLMVGHADGGAWTTLAEIKSIGEGTVRVEDPDFHKLCDGDLKKMWQMLTRPFKTHVNQVDIYLAICKLRGLPFTSAEFIYESKWNQQVKTFTIEYDERRSQRLVDQALAIKYAVDHREEPECRFPGLNDKGERRCENCAPYEARREVPVIKSATRTRR